MTMIAFNHKDRTNTPQRLTLWAAILLLLAGIGSGCAMWRYPPPEDTSLPSEAETNQPPPPSQISSSILIRPGSMLNITVFVAGKREIDAPNLRVSETGSITLPLLGSVRVAERSPQSVQQLLHALYSRYYINPQITFEVARDDFGGDAFPWGHVTVLGRVKNQGRVAIPPTQDMTVSRAIQQAGGFDTSARTTAIRVTRRMPDGEMETFDVNLRAVGTRGRTEDDIVLQPNDVVFVPELLF